MEKNYKPVILLLLLIAIVLFLAGFRLGKKIENMDKSYVPPTPFPSVTIAPNPTIIPSDYTTYKGPCNISFLYPSTLKEKSISSQSAILQDEINSNQFISIFCDTSKQTEESIITPASIKVDDVKADITELKKGEKNLNLYNLYSKQYITISLSENLLDLVLQTFKFEKPISPTTAVISPTI